MTTIKLQGIGEHKAIEVKDLQTGMAIVWNYGYESIVDAIEPSKTGKTYTLTLTSCGDGIQRKRRMNAHTLVAINDEVIVTIIGRRDGIHDAVCITDDENWEDTYNYYCEIAETEYVKVFVERSTNGGHTWEVIAEYVPTIETERYMVAADAVKTEHMSVKVEDDRKFFIVSYRRDEDSPYLTMICRAESEYDVDCYCTDRKFDWYSIRDEDNRSYGETGRQEAERLMKRGAPVVDVEPHDFDECDNTTADDVKRDDDVIWYPEEMETVTELDSDDFGTLYSVYIGHLNMSVSVYVTDEGTELFPSDWQTEQPQTIEEMADFDWYEVVDF